MQPSRDALRTHPGVPEGAVREQLRRMLRSPLFARSERLSRFLTFIVEQTLRGDGSGLKEQVILAELYGRGVAFDTSVDPIVRVDARRLRDRLREYYGEFPSDPVVIELPKGTYIPAFDIRVEPVPSVTATSQVIRWWGVALAVCALTIAAGLAFMPWSSVSRDRTVRPIPPSRRLTETGNVRIATLSPDGRRVAIVSGDLGARSLSVRDVDGSGFQVLLPTGPNHYIGVTFSPDGSNIYFVARRPPEITATLYAIASTGGVPHAIVQGVDSPVSFSPDGSEFAFVRERRDQQLSTLLVAARDGSRERVIASSKLPSFFDYPAWSPDGATIACARVDSRLRATSILLVDPRYEGRIRELISAGWPHIFSLSWSADGRSLFTAGRRLGDGQASPLWCIDARDGRMEPVTPALDNYYRVHSAAGRLVAIQHWLSRRVLMGPSMPTGEVPAGSTWVTVPERRPAIARPSGVPKVAWTADGKLITAEGQIFRSRANGELDLQLTRTGENTSAAPCGDGRYIVYTSENEGRLELWRVNADGTNPVRLVADRVLGSSDCSQDSRWVVYSAIGQGRWPTLWRVSIDGGAPRQLGESLAMRPSVSPDGGTIAALYADSRDGDQAQFQKLALFPARGGPPLKIFSLSATLDERVGPRWTPDGRAIAFIEQRGGASNIWAVPVTGGAARPLSNFTSDRVASFDWSMDGRRFAVSLSTTPHDVVLIDYRR